MKNGIVIFSQSAQEEVFWAWVISSLMKLRPIKEWLSINPSLN
jgi:hypothetical protein